jgi:hypothetical protein
VCKCEVQSGEEPRRRPLSLFTTIVVVEGFSFFVVSFSRGSVIRLFIPLLFSVFLVLLLILL